MSATLQQCHATVTKKQARSQPNTSCRPTDGTSVLSFARKITKVPGRDKHERKNDMRGSGEAVQGKAITKLSIEEKTQTWCVAMRCFSKPEQYYCTRCRLYGAGGPSSRHLRRRRCRSCSANKEQTGYCRAKRCKVWSARGGATTITFSLDLRGNACTVRCKARLCRGRGF